MTKIIALDGEKISHTALLHQILERSDVDGVVAVVRIDGCWQCCWSAGVSLGGLCMASMKLSSDITDEMHRSPRQRRDEG